MTWYWGIAESAILQQRGKSGIFVFNLKAEINKNRKGNIQGKFLIFVMLTLQIKSQLFLKPYNFGGRTCSDDTAMDLIL